MTAGLPIEGVYHAMMQYEGNVSTDIEVRPELSSQLSRLIFVGGAPRSGTTLVQRILNFHPQIYGGPEFGYVPRIVTLFHDMQKSIRSGRIDCILEEKALQQAIRSLIIALLLPKLRAEGASYLSEKTPHNALVFPWLEECAPEAKKILVVRDPRDVVNSMLEVGRRERQRRGRATYFVRDTIAAVEHLNQCLIAGAVLAEGSPNCLVVHYEDVVSDPLGAANRMFRFIGLPEVDCLNLESKKFDIPRDQEEHSEWHTAKTKSGPVAKGRVGLARQRLKRSDWDYTCAMTVRLPFLNNHYSLPSPKWTIAARWCFLRCLAARFKDKMLDLAGGLRRLLRGYYSRQS